jgi:hypothetical protein
MRSRRLFLGWARAAGSPRSKRKLSGDARRSRAWVKRFHRKLEADAARSRFLRTEPEMAYRLLSE